MREGSYKDVHSKEICQGAAAGWLTFVSRIVLGSIFLVSGLAKIADPIRFMFTLRAFQLIPETVIPFLAIILPWLEFFLGLLVLVGLLHRTAAIMLSVLSLTFMGAIFSLLLRGIEIDCGCFGLLADQLHLPDDADLRAVARNLILAAMGAYMFFEKRTRLSFECYLTGSHLHHHEHYEH